MINFMNKAYFKLSSISSFFVQNIGRRTCYNCREDLSQPLSKKPKWTSSEEAVKCIKSGDTIFLSGGVATPNQIPKDLANYTKSGGLKDVHIVNFFALGDVPYLAKEYKDNLRVTTLFVSPFMRQAVAEGLADPIPILLCDTPLLFSRGIIRPDVAIIQVSRPDEHGFCTLGTNVDISRAALICSKTIIAQVNKYMPRTFGDTLIHSSHIDYAVELDVELLSSEMFGKPPAEGEPEMAICKLIAENLVEDGATLQTGFGKIPDGIMASLTNHKDIGVHTEMFTDGIMKLVNSGVVTNHKKTLDRGKIVTSFFFGSKDLYKFVNNNPLIEMRVVNYTNNMSIINQQPKMTAINACIEVDITGQIVSDSIGTKIYSGFGGQLDFIKGASEALDGKGKPIIATLSVNPRTGDSKIVPVLRPGAGVVVSRAHVRYVVTEYGIADLFGKALRQRAHSLINIAHPDHRETLEKAAFERFKVMPSP